MSPRGLAGAVLASVLVSTLMIMMRGLELAVDCLATRGVEGDTRGGGRGRTTHT